MGRRAGRYVAAADVSLLNPVVTANAAGQGILAGNVVGRSTNLTLAYAPLTLTSHGARAGEGMNVTFSVLTTRGCTCATPGRPAGCKQ